MPELKIEGDEASPCKVLSQSSHTGHASFFWQNCDNKCEILLTKEDKLVPGVLIGDCSHGRPLPRMCPDSRLPERKNKPHYLYKQFRHSEQVL